MVRTDSGSAPGVHSTFVTDAGLGIAIGIMFTISPLWIGETCRPELRGFFLCFFNTSIVFGQFAMSVWHLPVILESVADLIFRAVVARGSSHLSGTW